MARPGLLYVTMQPQQDLSADEFHDWYNNEHGPTRMRLPYFKNGYRYRQLDSKEPDFLAVYDVDDVEQLGKVSYTRLRTDAVKTPREKETMAKIKIDRRIYDQLFVKAASSLSGKGPRPVLRGLAWKVGPQHAADFENGFEREHVPSIEKQSGWLRTRLFKTSVIDTQHEAGYLSLDEYVNDQAERPDTPWLHKVRGQFSEVDERAWELFYTFGQAPRELAALSAGHGSHFISKGGHTKTFPSPHNPAVESYIITTDGAVIPYRLEGSTDPDASVLVLVNSILVDWGIWDGMIAAMGDEKRRYRILRYNTRGRSTGVGSTDPITLDVLSSDLLEVLDALNVDKAAVAMGVSLGGATVLNAALRSPDRIPAFIACDTNAKAPESNPKAWGERIAVAEKEQATAANGMPVVGEELAEMTVRRWFVEASYDSGPMEERVTKVKAMVKNNNLEGFRASVRALYQYDMKDHLASATAKGTFVVGDSDGMLPKTMKEMANQYNNSGELAVIPGAGHLPMVENPQKVAEVVLQVLRG